MGITLNVDDCDPEKIHDSGGWPNPGHGMVLITNWDEFGGANSQAHVLHFDIAAWSNQEDVGKSYKENFFFEDKTGKGHPNRRFMALAVAAGLITVEELKAAREKKVSPDIDFSKLIGRPIMVVLEHAEGKKFLNVGEIGLAMYHIHDPKIATWPKNTGLVAQKTALVGNPFANTKKASAATQQPKQTTQQTTTAPPAAPADDEDPFA